MKAQNTQADLLDKSAGNIEWVGTILRVGGPFVEQ